MLEGAQSLEEEKKFFYEKILNQDLRAAEKVVRRRTNIPQEHLLLSQKIRTAFKDVTCPNSKNVLYGAYLFDDYYGKEASEEFYDCLSKNEERKDWQSISPEHIYACQACLTYLDAESFRFLAPAYMCYSLEYTPRYDLDSWLFFFCIGSDTNEYRDSHIKMMKDYYQLFTDDQKESTQECIDYWREYRLIRDDDDKRAASLLPWEYDDYIKNYASKYTSLEYLRFIKNW